MDNLPAIAPDAGAATYRLSTDAAEIARAIVMQTAIPIQGRKYVKVEGWQAIAVAHGCTASARGVERIEGGVRAIGEVRRMDNGAVIAEAEGFVGEDEPVWFGGVLGSKTLPKRSDFAIRAMAQTRAISRACRSAFAHVVVMIDKELGTTPAEEMQGVIQGEEFPDEDALAGLKRWASDQKGALAAFTDAEAVKGWHKKNLKQLDRLKKASLDEWETMRTVYVARLEALSPDVR